MTRSAWETEDAIEWAHDTMMEQFGNLATYNVVSGCEVTYDAADMTIDIAAGSITHNGTRVSVTGGANALTLVADGSNPRWSWIALDSAGSAVLVSGTAAADPTVPELGDYVELALVKIEAAQTIANNITYKFNKRLVLPSGTETTIRKTSNETVTSSTTLQNDNELVYAMAANTNYHFEISILYTGATAGDIKFSIVVPSGGDLWASGLIPSGGTVSLFGPMAASGSVVSSVDALGATNPTMIFIRGVVMNGSNAGDLQLQWAQGASSGTATTIYAGSYMKVWQ